MKVEQLNADNAKEADRSLWLGCTVKLLKNGTLGGLSKNLATYARM